MVSTVDYSYRYPIAREPRFPLLFASQAKQANKKVVTGLSGAYHPYETIVKFGKAVDVGGQKLPTSGTLDQRIPLERDLMKLYPSVRTNWSIGHAEPAEQQSMTNFHRYRRLKDYRPSTVPRVDDIVAYKYCPTCCALHVGACIGCSRNPAYFTHHSSPKMPYHTQKPHPPYGRGLYGFLHEKLDEHKTGKFWVSHHH